VADFRLLVEVVSPAETTRFGIVLDGYDVSVTRRLAPGEAFASDAVLRGDEVSWHDLVENIVTNGGSDISHSLNALSIAGWPLQLLSDDPAGNRGTSSSATPRRSRTSSTGSAVSEPPPPDRQPGSTDGRRRHRRVLGLRRV